MPESDIARCLSEQRHPNEHHTDQVKCSQNQEPATASGKISNNAPTLHR